MTCAVWGMIANAEVAHRPPTARTPAARRRVERLDGVGERLRATVEPQRPRDVGDGRRAARVEVAVEAPSAAARRRAPRQPDDDVDEPAAAGVDDPVAAALPSRIARDLVAGQDDLLELDLARSPAGDRDLVAQLAVDLDRDLAGRLDDRRASTSGQRSRVDRRPRLAGAASRRRHSSSVMCGAAGASISSSSRTASSHSGEPATAVPAVAEQRVRQLHQLGDHRVEAERLVVAR